MRYFILLLFVFVSMPGSAQTYKRFSVRFALGGASPYHGGSLFQFDPSYRLRDNLSVGVRFEGISGGIQNQSINLMKSYGLNAHHYFLDGNFRPYAGLGISLYSPQFVDGGTCACTYSTQSNIPGFYPRIGFDYKHFLLALEYNFIASSQFEYHDSLLGTSGTKNLNPDYFSLKLGVAIGGGRKK